MGLVSVVGLGVLAGRLGLVGLVGMVGLVGLVGLVLYYGGLSVFFESDWLGGSGRPGESFGYFLSI